MGWDKFGGAKVNGQPRPSASCHRGKNAARRWDKWTSPGVFPTRASPPPHRSTKS